MARPTLIFGAASFGMDFNTVDSVNEVLEQLNNLGITRIDTASRYPPLNPGMSEKLLGQAQVSGRGFTLDTKILMGLGDGSGELEASAIEKSLSTSFSALVCKKWFFPCQRSEGELPANQHEVNILHCHRPDPKTPLRDQAAALNEHYKKGSFKKLGVSNFPPELLLELLAICEKEGFVKPSVYQGDYNLVTRGMETNLLPILKANNMVCNAFRPLAGGFLTGQFTKGEHAGTRFSDDNPLGKHFQKLYGSRELQQAMKKLEAVVAGAGMPPSEAALRWLCFHSALGEKDGVILGASKLSHTEQNVTSISHGALPAAVVSAIEEMWSELAGQRGSIL